MHVMLYSIGVMDRACRILFKSVDKGNATGFATS